MVFSQLHLKYSNHAAPSPSTNLPRHWKRPTIITAMELQVIATQTTTQDTLTLATPPPLTDTPTLAAPQQTLPTTPMEFTAELSTPVASTLLALRAYSMLRTQVMAIIVLTELYELGFSDNAKLLVC